LEEPEPSFTKLKLVLYNVLPALAIEIPLILSAKYLYGSIYKITLRPLYAIIITTTILVSVPITMVCCVAKFTTKRWLSKWLKWACKVKDITNSTMYRKLECYIMELVRKGHITISYRRFPWSPAHINLLLLLFDPTKTIQLSPELKRCVSIARERIIESIVKDMVKEDIKRDRERYMYELIGTYFPAEEGGEG